MSLYVSRARIFVRNIVRHEYGCYRHGLNCNPRKGRLLSLGAADVATTLLIS